MDDATVQIILKAMARGLDEIKDVAAALERVRREAEITNAQLSFIGAAAFVSSNALSALADATNQKTTPALQGATAAASSGTSIWATLGSVLMGVAVTLGVLAGALAAPFIPLVVAATVVTTAFAVGVGAVTLALAAAFGPLAALTAGVIMLADRMFTTGKTAVDPLLQIEQALGKVADTWGKQATPMATAFLNALMPLVPLVQTLGTQVLTWFGGQMPAVIQITTSVAQALFQAFEKAGPIFAAFFGQMNQHRATFEQFFGLLLTVGLQAINGLLTNLLALSDWFLARLPAMAPIAAATIGAIGSAIQGVGRVAGEVVDFFIKNWPEITKQAQTSFNSIKAGWDQVAPLLQVMLPAALSIASQLMQYLTQNSTFLRGILELLGVSVGLVAGGLLILGTGALGAIAGLQLLTNIASGFTTVVDNATTAVWNFINALGSIPGGAGAVFGGTPGGPPSQRPTGVRAAGGPVMPGGTYTVGEAGPETLVMGSSGGLVIPNGGGGSSMGTTEDLLAQAVMLLARVEANTRGAPFSTQAYGARG